MKKMVAFIMQEAHEKAREIEVKADEEFAIEKAKLVRLDSASIEQQHERRLKQAEVKRRIAQSAHTNKARLQLLQARDQVLEDVLAKARTDLVALANDAEPAGVARYGDLLRNLVVQSLAKLAENAVDIVCREKDVALVQRVLAEAQDAFAKMVADTRVPVPSVSLCGGAAGSGVPGHTFLPSDCAGGVRATALGGRIVCDNTLETRLEHAFSAHLPRLRVDLFGPSHNRRFFD